MDQAAAWLDVPDYGGGQGCGEGQGCGVWPVVDHVEGPGSDDELGSDDVMGSANELGSDDDLEKSGG